MMKKCKFCSNVLSDFIDFGVYAGCNTYSCSYCPVSIIYIYINENHIATEFWIIKERDISGHTIKSQVIRLNFASIVFKNTQTFCLEIMEYLIGSTDAKIIYQSNDSISITPFNAERKLQAIINYN